LLVPTLLALAGVLAGAAGVAFLTAWAYLTLSIVGRASFGVPLDRPRINSFGCGLSGSRQKSFYEKDTASDPPVSQPVAPAIGETDLASQIAFTAAFVLARNLGKGRQD
jgi:hypothetical protein